MANNQLWDYAQKVGEQVSDYVDQAKTAIGAAVNKAQGGQVSQPTQQAQAQGTLAANSNVDPRYAQVQADRNAAMAEMNNTYGGMIGNTDQFYQDQINASKDWADKQAQLQQQQTDFTIEKVEQQKDQARKDYLKEQSGAYVDWQKQSNQYGANAEQQAAAGMAGTGFSESSQVSMYNTYQNRVMVARESYNQAVQNYNNAITEARLQNNSALAEIAYQALQQQLELSLEGFQYKNQLILEQADKKMELENIYYDRYLDVLNQINYEKEFAENVRQYNESLAFEREQFAEDVRQYNQSFEEEVRQYNQSFAEDVRQFDKAYDLDVKQFEEAKRQFEQNYDLQIKQFNEEKRQFDQQYKENVRQFNQSHSLKIKEYNESIRQFNEEIARLKKKDAQEYQLEIKNLELKKKQMEEDKRQYEQTYKLQKQQLEEEKRQFDTNYDLNVKKLNEEKRQFDETLAEKKKVSSSGGGGGGNDQVYQIPQIDEPKGSVINEVIKLGYGPISEKTLEDKVASGEVTVNSNGTLSRDKSKAGLTDAQKKLDQYTSLMNGLYTPSYKKKK